MHTIINYQPDIVECDDNNGNCSQICTNTDRSYECSCRNGYVLDSDGHNCSGTYFHHEVCHDNIQILLNAMITMATVVRYAPTPMEAMNVPVEMAIYLIVMDITVQVHNNY